MSSKAKTLSKRINASKALVAQKKMLSEMLLKVSKMQEELKEMEDNPDSEKVVEMRKKVEEKLEQLKEEE